MAGTRRENVKVLAKSMFVRADVDVARHSPWRASADLARRLDVATLFDVGANEGQYARLMRVAGFGGAIVSYEPMSREAGIAAARAESDSSWTVVNAALGNQPGSSLINRSGNSYSSSLLAVAKTHLAAAPRSRTVAQESVEVRTLQDEFERLGVEPRRCMVKVDTQGYEKAVLEGAGDLLEDVAALEVELSMVELYEGAPVFDDMYAWLRSRGWRLWSLRPGFSTDTGEMLQCDGVFIRGQA